MAEVIANPFEQIFEESARCSNPGAPNCDLAPSKQAATQWIRSFASAMQATSPLDGMEIIASIGPESMDGTCMIHCDLEKPSIKCRILTPPNPNACTSAVLTVVDRGDPKPDPRGNAELSWDGGTMSFRDEFSNVREFMNRFEPCRVNDGVNRDSIQNSFVPDKQRGTQAVNVGVGFTDNQGTRYGFCYIKSNSLSRSNLTLPDMRQPSGLGTLMMATPNPRFGGSLTERQCQDLLKTHYQMCIEKFNDRDTQAGKGAGLGYDTSQCDGLPRFCRAGETGCESRSACILKKKRDACAGISSWDVAEPTQLLQNESRRFGVPDAAVHCKSLAPRAGRSLPQGFAPRTNLQILEAPVMPTNLATQLPHTTSIVQEMSDERIQSRLNNCLEKCDGACTESGPGRCLQICEGLVLMPHSSDDTFADYTFDCKLNIQKEIDKIQGVQFQQIQDICTRASSSTSPPQALQACAAIESDSINKFREACASESPLFEQLLLACEGILNNTPTDCKVNWSDWGACSKQCGGGTQSRTATVTHPANAGGNQCPPLVETRACNSNPCVDCQVSNWSEWGACSRQCGGGTQSRSRSVTQQPGPGGAPCPPLLETRTCNTQICCNARPWSSWAYDTNNANCFRRQAATSTCPNVIQTQPCDVNRNLDPTSFNEQCTMMCEYLNYS